MPMKKSMLGPSQGYHYLCTLCANHYFRTKFDVQRHLQDQHTGIGYQCSVCKLIFVRRNYRHACNVREADMIYIHRETGVRGDEAKEMLARFIRETQDTKWKYVDSLDGPEIPLPSRLSVVVKPDDPSRQPRPRKQRRAASPLPLEEPEEIDLGEPPLKLPRQESVPKPSSSLFSDLECTSSISDDSEKDSESESEKEINTERIIKVYCNNKGSRKDSAKTNPTEKDKRVINVNDSKQQKDKSTDKESRPEQDKHKIGECGKDKSNEKENKTREDGGLIGKSHRNEKNERTNKHKEGRSKEAENVKSSKETQTQKDKVNEKETISNRKNEKGGESRKNKESGKDTETKRNEVNRKEKEMGKSGAYVNNTERVNSKEVEVIGEKQGEKEIEIRKLEKEKGRRDNTDKDNRNAKERNTDKVKRKENEITSKKPIEICDNERDEMDRETNKAIENGEKNTEKVNGKETDNNNKSVEREKETNKDRRKDIEKNRENMNRKEKVNKIGEHNEMESDSGKVEKEKNKNSDNTEELNGKKKEKSGNEVNENEKESQKDKNIKKDKNITKDKRNERNNENKNDRVHDKENYITEDKKGKGNEKRNTQETRRVLKRKTNGTHDNRQTNEFINPILDHIMTDITNTYAPLYSAQQMDQETLAAVASITDTETPLEIVLEETIDDFCQGAVDYVEGALIKETVNGCINDLAIEMSSAEKELERVVEEQIRQEMEDISRESVMDISLEEAEERRLREERQKQKETGREWTVVRNENRQHTRKRKHTEIESEENNYNKSDNDDSDTELSYLREMQTNRVILNIGGVRFETSRMTLRKDPNSLFTDMESNIMTQGNSIFVDRDSSHFRLILNYLRNGCTLSSPAILPRERKYLLELESECEYYRLNGLKKIVRKRLRHLTDL